jgi:hypothetical protein
MPLPARQRGSYAWALVFGLAAVALIGAAVVRARQASPMFPVSDEAMAELHTVEASHGRQLVGPYSRFPWHHPGPAYFYFLVPFYAAAGHNTAGLNAGALVLNVFALAVVAVILIRQRAYSLCVAFSAMGLFYIDMLAPMLASSWTAHAAVLPVAAAILTAASAATGDDVALMTAAVFGSLAVQTHVAVLPAVGTAVAGAAVSVAVLRYRHGAGERRWWLCAAVVLAVIWMPPIVDAAANRGGNLLRLSEYFLARPGSEQPFHKAYRAWAETLSGVVTGHERTPVGLPWRSRGPDLAELIAPGELVLLAATAFWAYRSRRSLHLSLSLLSLVCSAIALPAILRVPEELMDHQIFWVSAVGVSSAVALFGALLSIVFGRVHRATTWRFAAAATATALLLLSAARVGMMGLSAVAVRSRHPAADERFVRASVRALQPALATGGDRILVTTEPSTWMIGAGLLLQLHKQSVPVVVQPHLVGMYGETFRPDGGETLHLNIGNLQDGRRDRRAPGTTTIFERDGWFLEATPVRQSSR